jgi:hypothetical protein
LLVADGPLRQFPVQIDVLTRDTPSRIEDLTQANVIFSLIDIKKASDIAKFRPCGCSA